MTKLSVSIDAFDQETYDQVRVGGDYAKILKNIDDFLDVRAERGLDTPLFKVTFLKMPLNQAELPAFLNHWKDKADLISVQHPSNPWDGDEGAEKSEFLGVQRGDAPAVGGPGQITEDYEFDGVKCPSPFQRMTVRWDGDVLACCNFRGVDLVVGNAFESPIREIWQGTRMTEIQTLHAAGRYYEDPVCKACIEGSSIVAPTPEDHVADGA